MEFKVNFKGLKVDSRINGEWYISTSDWHYGISIEKKSIGFELLSHFNITAKDIEKDFIESISKNPTIEITEEIAKKSGLFNINNVVDIKVSSGFLNQFTYLNYNKESQIIENIFDQNAFLKYWVESGFKIEFLSDKDKDRIISIENEKKNKEEKDKKDKEEKENREQEKTNWIKEHGSQYLKDCLELGQYAHKEYVKERAEFEFPEFELDYEDVIKYDIRYSPTQAALNELKKIRTQYPKLKSDIVRLKEVIESEYYDEVNYYEAIVINNWLGKYDLIKQLDKIE